jgi:hypothetical protein
MIVSLSAQGGGLPGDSKAVSVWLFHPDPISVFRQNSYDLHRVAVGFFHSPTIPLHSKSTKGFFPLIGATSALFSP